MHTLNRTELLHTGYSIYCHYPWCKKKCPYCDFNSFKQSTPNDLEYFHALWDDISDFDFPESRPLISLFFGGGTPSLATADSIILTIEKILTHSWHPNTPEITIECNPGATLEKNLALYAASDINRLSIGAQSFSDLSLQKLGRIHSQQSIFQTFDHARKHGFDNINIDLMYHLPDQTVDEALDDLKKAIALSPDHISWYELTYEPNTVFAKTKPKRLSHDEAFRMTEEGLSLLASHGFQRYEISAFTRNKPCQHNQQYWTFGDYLGFGNGAHSKWRNDEGHFRWQKHRSPQLYQQKPSIQLHRRQIEHQELIFEFCLNHCRLQAPITRKLFESRTGLAWSILTQTLGTSTYASYFIIQEQTITLKPEGQLFLNDIMASLLES